MVEEMKQSDIARKAAAIFVDDGGDDAYEYATNYIWFDPTDVLDRHRAWKEAQAVWALRVSRLPASLRHTIAEPRLHPSVCQSWTEEDLRASA